MEYFLKKIAKSLYAEFETSLNHHCLVFPNRRAGLYFLKYLSAEINKPVWSPAIITINEFFRSFSRLQTTDNEILLFELYRIYRKLKKSSESFDDFYFWGEILINDFDDVDKYLVNASVLFQNVKDIKNIDRLFGGLTEDQINIIKKFWTNFEYGKPTREKEEFVSIWSVLYQLYSDFRIVLREKNLAYEGMIFRDLAEISLNNKPIEIRWNLVHFIGFNALNNCEKAVMRHFKKEGKARFYWDYDNSYITGKKLCSAGLFMRENLKIFGNDMPVDWNYNTLLSSQSPSVHWRVINTSSDIAQVKLIPQVINNIRGLAPHNAHHTAIVLADENLLMPALTSLPQNIGDINITMGYPMKHTNVYSLIKLLLLLQKNSRVENEIVYFGYKDVISILKHKLISHLIYDTDNDIISDIIKSNLIWVPSGLFAPSAHLGIIFKKINTPALFSEYLKNILGIISSNHSENQTESQEPPVQRSVRNEFIYRVMLSINRLEVIVNDQDVSFSIDTYSRILDRNLKRQSVPFSGEPLSGIQIMGILETRALDFENLIMLSVNEGVIPGVSASSSFIPYNLRVSFGLPDTNHQESIFAYHFYRLLQRAENVTFVYNSNSDGLRNGEMSRFLLQMKYEPELKPKFLSIGYEIKTRNSLKEIVERTEEHSQQLVSLYCDKNKIMLLSPTAINTWLGCRMRFYYRYVNTLKEPAIISSEIDHAMFGNMLHEIMKIIYSDYVGKEISKEILNSLIGDEQRQVNTTEYVINEKFGKGGNSKLSGNELIVKDILLTYLKKILDSDRLLTPITILELEETYNFKITLNHGKSGISIRTGGHIDRVDKVEDTIRIVDYKTGKVAEKINSIGDLFTDDRQKDIDGWLQTLLYCEAYTSDCQGSIIRPSVYKIKELTGEDITDRLIIKRDKGNVLIVNDYSEVREEFINGLYETIRTIFSKDEPFIMTSDNRKCIYCPYHTLCMR